MNTVLHMLLSGMQNNFCNFGVDKNGKAFCETDSEVAADALEETLYNLGYIKLEDESFDDSVIRHYSRIEVYDDGLLMDKFIEL